jgi:hypothetical protein
MRLNNKGFAISGVLYSMFILIIILMFLILGILAGRRLILSKISKEAEDSVNIRVGNKIPCDVLISDATQVATYETYGNDEIKLKANKGGHYLIQAWGGAGFSSDNGVGGGGAYASAIVYVAPGNYIYAYLGQGGSGDNDFRADESFNGGGAGSGKSGAGGGATIVSTKSINDASTNNPLVALSEHKDHIILVAAGGGGAGMGDGGAGGGFDYGIDGNGSGNGAGSGASSTSGGAGGTDINSMKKGTAGSFGVGGNAGKGDSNTTQGGGGGGGYYGGGGAAASATNNGGGGGGVSYVNEDILAMTRLILKKSSIYKVSYNKYVGVAINGNEVMPVEPNCYPTDNQAGFACEMPKDETIFTNEKEGHRSSGAIRITRLVCKPEK